LTLGHGAGEKVKQPIGRYESGDITQERWTAENEANKLAQESKSKNQ
jgi:hypothetical protein